MHLPLRRGSGRPFGAAAAPLAVALLCGAACLSLARPAAAQLLITLNPNTQTLAQGQTVTFAGTIQNFSGAPVTVDGINFSFADPSATLTASSLFATPRTLAAGSITENLFTVTAAANTPVGTYDGTYTLFSGINSFNDTFVLNVIVPAPPAALVFGGTMGLVGLAQAGRSHLGRRRRKAIKDSDEGAESGAPIAEA